eukprot:747217-Hanusia_phi.AAC.3
MTPTPKFKLFYYYSTHPKKSGPPVQSTHKRSLERSRREGLEGFPWHYPSSTVSIPTVIMGGVINFRVGAPRRDVTVRHVDPGSPARGPDQPPGPGSLSAQSPGRRPVLGSSRRTSGLATAFSCKSASGFDFWGHDGRRTPPPLSDYPPRLRPVVPPDPCKTTPLPRIHFQHDVVPHPTPDLSPRGLSGDVEP